MLVDVHLYTEMDPIAKIIAEANNNSPKTIHHETGVYEIGHFSFEHCFTDECNTFPDLNIADKEWNEQMDCFGVCDSYQQVLKKCPELISLDRKFVMSITPILKENQSDWGGWRWHKWGEYIGTQKPTCEYIYDEPIIEKVYCYHILEIV